jgi:hypothetical protein
VLAREVVHVSSGGVPSLLPTRGRRGLPVRPTTRLGTWAVVLAAVCVVLLLSWSALGRLGGIPGLACGLVGGVLALVAIARRGERALVVFAAVVPFLSVVAFLLAELLIGHQ